jgi:hypothetical protein
MKNRSKIDCRLEDFLGNSPSSTPGPCRNALCVEHAIKQSRQLFRKLFYFDLLQQNG